MGERGISTGKIAVILVIAVVGAVFSGYFLLTEDGEETPRGEGEEEEGLPEEGEEEEGPSGEETYDLLYDYEVGEHYNYETTTTTTSIRDNIRTETSSSSAYSIRVVAVEDNEFTLRQISTETIGPPYLETREDVEVTSLVTIGEKGEMVSWEIENVVPSEYRRSVEAYENSMAVYWELFGFVFPEDAVSAGHEWKSSVEAKIPWGPFTLPVTGGGTGRFVGEESVTVEAGTFDCWRIEYSASIAGESTFEDLTVVMDMTYEETSWLDKQNFAQIKSTYSYSTSYEYDNTAVESLSEVVTELTEYGTS